MSNNQFSFILDSETATMLRALADRVRGDGSRCGLTATIKAAIKLYAASGQMPESTKRKAGPALNPDLHGANLKAYAAYRTARHDIAARRETALWPTASMEDSDPRRLAVVAAADAVAAAELAALEGSERAALEPGPATVTLEQLRAGV